MSCVQTAITGDLNIETWNMHLNVSMLVVLFTGEGICEAIDPAENLLQLVLDPQNGMKCVSMKKNQFDTVVALRGMGLWWFGCLRCSQR